MKKLAALLLALTVSMGLSASAFSAEEKTHAPAKTKKAAAKKAESNTPDVIPMPADLKPSYINSIFSIDGGSIVLKDSWVILQKVDTHMITLAPWEDQTGEKTRMLLVADDTPESTDLMLGTKLLSIFRTKVCGAEFDPEKVFSYVKIFETSSGQAFSATCKRGNKTMVYQIDAVKGDGDYHYGVMMGYDHQGILSDKEIQQLEAKQIKHFQSLFLSVGPSYEKMMPGMMPGQ